MSFYKHVYEIHNEPHRYLAYQSIAHENHTGSYGQTGSHKPCRAADDLTGMLCQASKNCDSALSSMIAI